jgi:hypothetical protein
MVEYRRRTTVGKEGAKDKHDASGLGLVGYLSCPSSCLVIPAMHAEIPKECAFFS